MFDYKELWKQRITDVLRKQDDSVSAALVTAEIPPRPEMGDLGFPMFGLAKLLRKSPPQIAQAVAAELAASWPGNVNALGPYVNVKLDRKETVNSILSALLLSAPGEATAGKAGRGVSSDVGSGICRPGTLSGSRIMVEYSSPNTNKPLHLGHLRNDVLGESISRILEACGAEVRRVCIINDRGIHICKSMLAYMEHGEGKTPESERIKSDHFVGNWYVAFNRDLKEEVEALEKQGLSKKEAEAQAPVMLKAQDLLRRWEAGDDNTVQLWKKMNAWAIGGMEETYRRTGVRFDQYYFESQTYLLGKDEILKGLEKGIFFREEDGSVQVDLTEEKLDKKVLLRKDGTSIYVTQDIGTAIYRYRDWPFHRLVYVVGSEQQYHFKVLFLILKKLGLEWAESLYHLSYGMVNLPEGKMKSREGTVVDADDLIDSLKNMAVQEIREKEREEAVGDAEAAAERIAIGALHYFLLQVSPSKDMLFDPKESLSFNGNTGPYLQYMGARISSLLRKAAERGGGGVAPEAPRFELLTGDAEWDLVKTLASYNDAVAAAAEGMDPSLVAAWLYELARAFSRFYHDCPILSAEEPGLANARLALCRAVLLVLKDALYLTCIPFLEVM